MLCICGLLMFLFQDENRDKDPHISSDRQNLVPPPVFLDAASNPTTDA